MKYLSVCSGIEAASVAWEPLGWSPVAFSEIEKFPSAVLAHHWPDVPNLGDMTQYHGWNIGSVDLVVAGTPCQAFSCAGLRQGLADPRGNLTLVFLGILERIRPTWVVWENVPGVLSDRTGAFGSLLGGLAELGYGFAYRVLDAQYFGVPQRRKRVFLVGHLGDWRRAAAVLFERESLSGHPAPSRQTRQDLAPTIAARTRGSGGLGTDAECDGALIPSHDPACCLTARERKGALPEANLSTVVSHTLRGTGFDASEDGTGHHSSHANGGGQVAIAWDEQLNASVDQSGTLLRGGQGGRHDGVMTLAIRGRGDGRNLETRADGTANAILTPNGGRDGMGVGAIVTTHAVRRLTPTECERLQGFPDGHTQIEWRGKPADQCPDGPRYKALGNSMAVPVMHWIGRRIRS